MRQKPFKIYRLLLTCLALLGFVYFCSILAKPQSVEAAAGVNQQLNFQGRLLNSQGATVPDGFYNVQFKIYQDGDGQSVGNTTGSPAGSRIRDTSAATTGSARRGACGSPKWTASR